MKTILKTAAIAGALLACAGSAHAQSSAPTSYKAVRDFSYRASNGVWSYGYGSAGDKQSFKLYKTGLVPVAGGLMDAFGDSESVVGVSTQTKTSVYNPGSSQLVIPTDVLFMHPRSDGQETMVVFTAPASGVYKIEGLFAILDNAPSSVKPRIVVNSTDLSLAAFGSKTEVVLSGAADPDKKKVGGKRSFSLTRKLAKGARVQFAVNPNGDWRFDSTGFSATITPVPAP